MKEKINKWLPWINVVLLSIVLISLVPILEYFYGYINLADKLGYIFIAPSSQLMGFDVLSAIDIFAGNPIDSAAFFESVVIAGTGLIVLLVVAPFLMVKGYQGEEESEPGTKKFSWYAGTCIILISFFFSLVSFAVGTTTYFKVNDNIANSRDSDHLSKALTNLAIEASSLTILPQEYGGGNGSFTGFIDEEGRPAPLELDKLNSYNSAGAYEFVLYEDITDSSITIVGVSDYEGRDKSFQNINGEIGKRQLSIKVHPYEEHIFTIKRSGLTN